MEIAAAKAVVSAEKLLEWEAGASQPTIRQAKNLAKAYRRPFALFFLPDVPYDFTPLNDFRKKGSKPLSSSSIFIIREIQQKQEWIKELYKENGEEPLPFVGRFSIEHDPAVVARDILTTLDINPLSYKPNSIILQWVRAAERKGIFVSRTGSIHPRQKLDVEELQGFAIADPHAPFVFVNTTDWKSPQLFTLVHEIAHLWIEETSISNEIKPGYGEKDKYHPAELFCNEVAANALMPREVVQSFNPSLFQTSMGVKKIANSLGVSTFAVLVRVLNLNIVSLPAYRQLKRQAEIDFAEHIEKEEQRKEIQKKKPDANAPSYHLLQLNRNGALFTQTVLDAYRGGEIAPTEASGLLNVKINNFQKLESYISG